MDDLPDDREPNPSLKKAPIENRPLELTQQQKAEAALRAIADGGNPTYEAYLLANDFTDRLTARWSARLKSLIPRRRRGNP